MDRYRSRYGRLNAAFDRLDWDVYSVMPLSETLNPPMSVRLEEVSSLYQTACLAIFTNGTNVLDMRKMKLEVLNFIKSYFELYWIPIELWIFGVLIFRLLQITSLFYERSMPPLSRDVSLCLRNRFSTVLCHLVAFFRFPSLPGMELSLLWFSKLPRGDGASIESSPHDGEDRQFFATFIVSDWKKDVRQRMKPLS